MNNRIRKKRQKRWEGCSYSETRKWFRIMKPIFHKHFKYCREHHISDNYLVNFINDELIQKDVPFRVYTTPWDGYNTINIVSRRRVVDTITKLEIADKMDDVVAGHDWLHEEEG